MAKGCPVSRRRSSGAGLTDLGGAARLCLAVLVLGLLLPSTRGLAQSDHAARHLLPTLTMARQAHSLSTDQARRGYPIHLTAVVTYYGLLLDLSQPMLYVHDASGSIFILMPAGSQEALTAGTLVDVKGVSAMGDFAPILTQPHIRVIRRSHLPSTAPAVSLAELLTGSEDGQWVEVEGVVHSVFETEHNISLQLAMRDGTITATLPREPGADYQHLVDARVKIHANEAPVFNGHGQMIGACLFIPALSAVKVIEGGLEDAFMLPVRTIASLFRYTPKVSLPRRIHVRGSVTLFWPGSLLCIGDATHGLCAQTLQATPLALHDMVDVVGFAEGGGLTPSLSDAVFRSDPKVQSAWQTYTPALDPPTVTSITAPQALYGYHDSELVELDGQLIGRDLAAKDTTLMLASKGFVYAVLLPHSMVDAASNGWKNGSRLRVTGICSVQLDAQKTSREGGPAARKSFRILLRSSKDVLVLRKPSWWTPVHTEVVLVVVLSATLLVLGWVVVLTRRLKQQTQVIRESEERFRHLAQHDALTGLPTRLLLRDRLNSAIERAKRSGAGLALLMLDLDNFKLINDSLGHHAGDLALKATAQRISAAVRRSDTVARISGDEFVVLISELSEPKEAELVAAKIVAALAAPFRCGDQDVPLSASVGVCTASGGGVDADALLKRVDTAMYQAKAHGRNCFQLYTADMARFAEESLRLRTELGRALPANELEVHYQPMVDFATGALTGFEALLRWRSKEMGLMMPGDFIPVAEQTGLIVPIGAWVLREACREIGLLEKQLGRSFLLSVNLSPLQIQQQQLLPDAIRQTLLEADRAPHLVEFEITESMLMSDSVRTHAALLELRRLGVRLAIDDFGMGFSSLSYITRFSVDRIKIDRSFVRKSMREGGNLAVVRAIVAMAHGLSMDVVAEGVETAAEFAFLREEGCDTAQGYYLSRPLPADQLPQIVSQLQDLAGAPSTRLTLQGTGSESQ